MFVEKAQEENEGDDDDEDEEGDEGKTYCSPLLFKNVILKSFNVMLFVNYKCVIPRMILICLLQILTKPKSFCKHLCLSIIIIILYSPNS